MRSFRNIPATLWMSRPDTVLGFSMRVHGVSGAPLQNWLQVLCLLSLEPGYSQPLSHLKSDCWGQSQIFLRFLCVKCSFVCVFLHCSTIQNTIQKQVCKVCLFYNFCYLFFFSHNFSFTEMDYLFIYISLVIILGLGLLLIPWFKRR